MPDKKDESQLPHALKRKDRNEFPEHSGMILSNNLRKAPLLVQILPEI